MSQRECPLDAQALDAARVWTTHLKAELVRDGRAIEGGWPGTLSEARGRCAHAMPGLASTEIARLTRLVYDEARRLWRASNRSTT